MTAGCHSLAVDLPEHSSAVEQLAYIQCAGSSILSVPIGGGTDIKPQQRSFYMTSSFTLGVFLYIFLNNVYNAYKILDNTHNAYYNKLRF